MNEETDVYSQSLLQLGHAPTSTHIHDHWETLEVHKKVTMLTLQGEKERKLSFVKQTM